MKITYLCLIPCLTLVAADQPSEASGTDRAVLLTPEYIGQLSEEMRTNHPALRAADARTESGGANVDAVRTWEDPMARLGGMAAPDEMRADEGDVIYGIEQKLPLFGKPRLARRVARAELAVESANTEYQFQLLRAELAGSTFRAALAGEVIAIGEQDLAWLDVMVQAVEGKYRAGQATLVNLLELENERAKRKTQVETDRDKLAQQRVALNRLLHREVLSPWPVLELPPIAGPVFFNQRLLDFALKYEPKIAVMRRQIEQGAAVVDVTRRERWPDVNVGLEARNYSGDASFRQGMLMFSMNLPWGNTGRYRNDIKREQARLRSVEFDLEDYQAGLREEVHGLTVSIAAARREALLYRDEVVPRSQSALDSARAGWEANQIIFRDMLEIRRMLLDARLMHVRAVSEQYQMMSELVLCCGLGDLQALQMIGAEPDVGGSPE